MKSVLRMIQIVWLALSYGLDDHLTIKASKILKWVSTKSNQRHQFSKPYRLTHFLTQLGPVYIKFGQALSTRGDLLPSEYIKALSNLQDNVPPFNAETFKLQVINSLDKPLDDLFKFFDDQPLASASIAQVHSAILHSGEHVVVKSTRPGIKKIIQKDIKVMRAIAKLIECFTNPLQTRLQELISEFETTIYDELDMNREAANSSQLKRSFKGSSMLYLPNIYWDYTTEDVLVLEKIKGININQVEKLKEKKVDLKKLAAHGVEIFFTQVLRDSFFHADMHPGNVFVDVTYPENPKYIAIDFGIMGSLSPKDQYYIASNLHAFFNHDYRKVAELHIESGWVPKETRIDQFEQSIRAALEPIIARPIKEISFGKLLMRLLFVAKRYRMIVQPQLLLLQKTLMNVEGLGRELYPDLNLWETAKPCIEKWLVSRQGWGQIAHTFKDEWPKILHEYPKIPGLILKNLENINNTDQIKSKKTSFFNINLNTFLLGSIIIVLTYPL